jgi:hypothetical protein
VVSVPDRSTIEVGDDVSASAETAIRLAAMMRAVGVFAP